MGTPERTRNARGEGDKLRVALLDAAESLLAEVGDVGGLSLRGVTARAGVTPNALYLHFGDLGDLVLALESRAFAELRVVLEAAECDHDGDQWAQLVAMGAAYCQFADLRPATYRLLFGTYVSGAKIMPRDPDERAAASKDAGIETFNTLARAVGRCVPELADPFPLAVQVWCSLHGYVSLQPVMPSFPFPPREEFLTGMLPALLGKPEPPSGAPGS
jgi:AcrR family transcriptional regulator